MSQIPPSNFHSPVPKRSNAGLVALLFVLGLGFLLLLPVVVMLVALLLPAVQASR